MWKWSAVHTNHKYSGSHLLKYNQYQIHQDNEWLDRFLQQKNLICWICSLVKIERKKPIPRYWQTKRGLTIVRMFSVINCRHYSVICQSGANSEKLKYKTKHFLSEWSSMNDMWSILDQNRESMSTYANNVNVTGTIILVNISIRSSLSSSSSSTLKMSAIFWEFVVTAPSAVPQRTGEMMDCSHCRSISTILWNSQCFV